MDFYELRVPGIRPWVSLGCSVEERASLQPVDVDLCIRFDQEPLGCKTDQLGDVVCYKELSEEVLKAAQERPFNLIESLAACLFDLLAKKPFLEGALVKVTVAKPNHPVPQVQKPIIFTYCRRLPQKRS